MTDVLARLTISLADRYVIERELGAGGMATVYLAHDVRHDRKVALKVLRPELAAILGGERFLKEIRTTANLQHPHILPLHDSGDVDGMVFYVMPYVEGESLRDRLVRDKQLPVDDAVRIAREVASALDYAHRHDVVHRDIKPENILLHDGQALVADFGIALAVSTVGGGTRMTETGMSLGTPHYMAPEQAMGDREITPRADIYALGVVLYEMLTGDPPFTGSTAQAIVARVVTEAPRGLVLQRHTIQPHVEAAVLKALEKLPADRFTSAAEFAAALSNPGFTAVTAAAAPAPLTRRDWRARAALPLAGSLVAALALAGWALMRGRPVPPVTRYGLAFAAGQAALPEAPFALSPDGARLAYVGPAATGTQLWIKERSRFDATALPGTANVFNVAFSPDGEWLAFVQMGELKKLAVTGGAAITLADSVSGNPGLAWLDDGSIVYILAGGRQLRRIPGAGGQSAVVWRADTAELGTVPIAMNPTPLPGSHAVLFTRCVGGRCGLSQELWWVDLRSGTARSLVAGVAKGWYAATGHIVYVRRDGAVFAVGFDAARGQVRGSAVPVLDSVSVINDIVPLAALSLSGTMAVRPGAALSSRARFELVWVDRAGREAPVDSGWTFRSVSFGGNAGLALSPDGNRVAIGVNTDVGDDIWVKQLPRGPASRVTYDSASEYRPRWTRDGRAVLFASNRSPSANLYRRAADGTGSDELVLDLADGIYEGAYARDGSWLLARTGGTLGQVGGRNIYGVHVGSDTAAVPLVASTTFDEAAAALSPDGRWLAYESNESGRTEVYLRPFPSTDAAKWQVSNGGGVAPLWPGHGRELFYVNASRQMVAVSIAAAGSGVRLGEPRVLFRMREDLYLSEAENYTPYDVTADGQRFLMARRIRTQAAAAAPLIVADNWLTELVNLSRGGRSP